MTGFEYFRKKNVLEVADLARIVGVQNQAVYKWESGKILPKSKMLVKLAKLYGITIDELVMHYESPASELEKRLEMSENGRGKETCVHEHIENPDDS